MRPRPKHLSVREYIPGIGFLRLTSGDTDITIRRTSARSDCLKLSVEITGTSELCSATALMSSRELKRQLKNNHLNLLNGVVDVSIDPDCRLFETANVLLDL